MLLALGPAANLAPRQASRYTKVLVPVLVSTSANDGRRSDGVGRMRRAYQVCAGTSRIRSCPVPAADGIMFVPPGWYAWEPGH
jgi:hypothetical protein